MLLPPSNFAVFGGYYFLCFCLQRAENCTNCSNKPTLSTFEFILCIWWHPLWVCMLMTKNITNEISKDSPIVFGVQFVQDCSRWEQISTTILAGLRARKKLDSRLSFACPGPLLAGLVHPLSPNINIQILLTDLYTFPIRTSWKNLITDQEFLSLWSFYEFV